MKLLLERFLLHALVRYEHRFALVYLLLHVRTLLRKQLLLAKKSVTLGVVSGFMLGAFRREFVEIILHQSGLAWLNHEND